MQKTIITVLLLIGLSPVFAQEKTDFIKVYDTKTSPVKNQGRTGTCWSFTTCSFLESEILKSKNKELDLSEMFIAYYAYLQKAEDYLRFHGKGNFSEGGQAHDVINVIKQYGLMPESAYSGFCSKKQKKHNHASMVDNLTSVLENALKGKKLSPTWKVAFKALLNSHLGEIPETFVFQGKKYTSKTFCKQAAGINPDDYIEFTSYTHHPFYTTFDLEVPDNWSHDVYYNVPIDDLTAIMDNALKNGYSIAWDGDVSEKGFVHKTATATLSKEDKKQIKAQGMQAFRQSTFDDFSTTDDHLMHITGKVKDKEGTLYYKTKNSWGAYNQYDGFLFMSEDYIRIKTVAILVNKNAVPANIAKKCGIK
ncbi:MAG: aminopeptidase [Bacteroidia bacterium]|nr:MAG: aminopeptidase [Bacteroidia bacterium]